MIFITLEEVLDFHAEIIQIYGGLNGIRDMGLLQSALEMPKAVLFGEELHPSIFDKAAAYLFHIICNHPFLDGNKRTGTIVALTFLRFNNVQISLNQQSQKEFEELIVDTAQGRVTKQILSHFLEQHKKVKKRRRSALRKRSTIPQKLRKRE